MLNKIKRLFRIWKIKNDLKGLNMVVDELNRMIYLDRCELNEMRGKILHGKREPEFYEKEMEELTTSIDLYEDMKNNARERMKSLKIELDNLKNK